MHLNGSFIFYYTLCLRFTLLVYIYIFYCSLVVVIIKDVELLDLIYEIYSFLNCYSRFYMFNINTHKILDKI